MYSPDLGGELGRAVEYVREVWHAVPARHWSNKAIIIYIRLKHHFQQFYDVCTESASDHRNYPVERNGEAGPCGILHHRRTCIRQAQGSDQKLMALWWLVFITDARALDRPGGRTRS